ncbi:mitochondrial uncoupling protein 1 [Tanacetum coccineum]
MLGTVGTIAKEEGLASLWKGIVPGLHRQCLFGGLRIGLYEPVRSSCFFISRALAISVANPTDLVKVRLQAEGKLAPGVPRRYSGSLNSYSTIEGVRALWTGLGPNVARNAIINAAELASYDQVKQTILKIPGFTDNVLTHLLSGLGAGFLAVCVGSPVDVGQFAFYKGFIPNFKRLGSWNVIMFLTLEQAKKVKREEAKITTWENLQKPKAEALLGNMAGLDTLLVKQEEAKIIAWENLQKPKAEALFRNMSCGRISHDVQKFMDKKPPTDKRCRRVVFKISEDALDRTEFESIDPKVCIFKKDFIEKYVMYFGSGATEVKGCGHQIDFLSILRRAMNH